MLGTSTTSRSTSTTIVVAGSASIASHIRSTAAFARTTGTRPFFVQLLRKMSEKLGAITASKPYCWSAHTACSRDEPTPNAGPATRIVGAGEALVVEHEVAVVAPRREQALLVAGALDPLEPLGGDDLVGVDVGARAAAAPSP